MSATRLPAPRQHTPKIGVLLAHRHTLDCLGLATLIRCAGDLQLLGSTTMLNELLPMCEELIPDVVVIDASYPNGTAFDTVEKIIAEKWARRILFLDDNIKVSRINRALEMDSVSYYSKNSSFEELRRGIRKLYAGEETFDPALYKDFFIHPTQRRVVLRVDAPSIANLTRRELDVLKLLAEGKSVLKVAEHLSVAANTVDNHKASLMKKLNVHKVAQLTLIAVREGIVD